MGLKKAAADGTECPDGQQPAKPKRGRTPGAKSKAKAKTQPKPTEKAKAKAKGKITRKATSVLDDGDNPASPSNPPAAPKRKTKPSTQKADGEPALKKPKVPKKVKPEAASPSPAPTTGAQCFARRKRPTSKFGGVKWDAIRQAFQQKVKPLLKSYSAFEDHGWIKQMF